MGRTPWEAPRQPSQGRAKSHTLRSVENAKVWGQAYNTVRSHTVARWTIAIVGEWTVGIE